MPTPSAPPDPGRDAFMEMAWAGFIQWAGSDPEVCAQYREETGRIWPPTPARSGIEAMVDHATGHLENTSEDFAIWATERLWGIDEAPAKLRERIAELQADGSADAR